MTGTTCQLMEEKRIVPRDATVVAEYTPVSEAEAAATLLLAWLID